MRWIAHFFLNGQSKYERNNFGLKSKESPPFVKEMKGFEEDLVLMVERLRFREVNDPFLTKIDNDLRKVNPSSNMYIFADKTRNLYETTPDQYDKILKDNITKSYKLGETNMLNNVNEDLRDIAIDLSIDNRIETMANREAFVTAKDHKENFEDNPKFRLINPAKSELGKVSKIILDEINNNIRERTGVNQWRNSQSVIDWFKTINDKPNHTFISFASSRNSIHLSRKNCWIKLSAGLGLLHQSLTNKKRLSNTHVPHFCSATIHSLNKTQNLFLMQRWAVITALKYATLSVYIC